MTTDGISSQGYLDMMISTQHPLKMHIYTHTERKTPLLKSTSYTVSGDRHLISRCFKGDCTVYCVFVTDFKGHTKGLLFFFNVTESTNPRQSESSRNIHV